jgi:hypothetical protein
LVFAADRRSDEEFVAASGRGGQAVTLGTTVDT